MDFLTRHRTFLKRKGGLFKKAHELSVLCSVNVAVIIFGHNKKLYEFASSDINDMMARYQYVCKSLGQWRLRLTSYSMVAPTNTKDLQIFRARTMMMRMKNQMILQ